MKEFLIAASRGRNPTNPGNRTPGKEVLHFKSMKECCRYFGFTKSWLGNYIHKNGNPCIYKGFQILVGSRGGDAVL